MGHGYWILLCDSWGVGLTMINPRLFSEGVDDQGNPRNWFPLNKEVSDQEIIENHNLDSFHGNIKVIR